MEEDNALDILRWLFKDGAATALTDHAGPVKLERNARLLDCEVSLHFLFDLKLFSIKTSDKKFCLRKSKYIFDYRKNTN
jgi:hypothetical protein